MLLRPIRLAVYFDQAIHVGGGYQQALNAALMVKKVSSDLVDPLFFTNHKGNIKVLADLGIEANYFPLRLFGRIGLKIRNCISETRYLRSWKKYMGPNEFERPLLEKSIDLVYFLSPCIKANDLETLNYITTVWDLCHRDYPEFPEVRSDRIFENRERLYTSILPKAVAILVDSELGKDNLMRRYGVDDDRIHIMPFMPSLSTDLSVDNRHISIKEKYVLNVPYIFYPAQYWAHKNHVYLLEGLRILEELYGRRVGAIFAGGDMGNMLYVKKIAKEFKLSDRIRFPGFVSNEEIPYLYKQSLALVMPTYFGPTNLPPLEAFKLGVPVLYPDKPGLRDQVGNAALLIDLKDPRTMADHLEQLISNPTLGDDMIKKGQQLFALKSDFNQLRVLTEIFDDFIHKRASWESY